MTVILSTACEWPDRCADCGKRLLDPTVLCPACTRIDQDDDGIKEGETGWWLS